VSERPEVQEPRQRLLGAVVDAMTARGATGWSLRSLADAVDTSHRMLIYHFGSMDGLMLAVTQEVEARQRARLTALSVEHDDPITAARALWAELADPTLAAHERLFFELYAAALQGHEHALPLLDGAVTDWLELLTAAFVEMTGDAESAPTDARLGIAVVRGLLLDLLATGDAAAVTAAHERYLALYR
jgi:AcrR family transcriptional regulator